MMSFVARDYTRRRRLILAVKLVLLAAMIVAVGITVVVYIHREPTPDSGAILGAK
jgi:hypothetical protein